MKILAFAGLEPSGTTVESLDKQDDCDKCVKLDDGFPCANCYIPGRKDFSEDYA
ncbi:hypothetical protein [Halorussus sp. MSC15.2]|uniref:hypothetical protein n=1 Tax=Halorussus sp. MSC15.2 TaxID=2283638 RepID=UPI0013D09DD8|nr:hypothetical protein [Halorussus sp. MSC15.2]NEU58763.1 hypothetical protein [Halorussus sp. MSC15.2]